MITLDTILTLIIGSAIILHLSGLFSEKRHPHRDRFKWTLEERLAHLKEYHPDAYQAYLELQDDVGEDPPGGSPR